MIFLNTTLISKAISDSSKDELRTYLSQVPKIPHYQQEKNNNNLTSELLLLLHKCISLFSLLKNKDGRISENLTEKRRRREEKKEKEKKEEEEGEGEGERRERGRREKKEERRNEEEDKISLERNG